MSDTDEANLCLLLPAWAGIWPFAFQEGRILAAMLGDGDRPPLGLNGLNEVIYARRRKPRNAFNGRHLNSGHTTRGVKIVAFA